MTTSNLPAVEISLAQEALSPNTLRMRNAAAKKYYHFATGKRPGRGNSPDALREPLEYLRDHLPDSQDLIKFTRWLARVDGMSVNTAEAYISHLNALCRATEDRSPRAHFRVKQELTGFRKLRPSSDRHSKPITFDVLKQLVPHVTPELALAFTLAYVFALRGGEVVRIRHDEIEMMGGRVVKLTIPFSKTSPTPVTITQEMPPKGAVGISMSALLTYALTMGRDTLFKMGYTTFNAAVKRAAWKAGLSPQDYSTHGFRSGRVTDLLAAGVQPHVAQLLSRHESQTMLLRYNQPNIDRTQLEAGLAVMRAYEEGA